MLIHALAQPSKGNETNFCQGLIGITFNKDNMTMGITQKIVLMK